MPKRSASPSVASPVVAFESTTVLRRGTRFFFGDVGTGSVEKAIAFGAQALHRDAVIVECAVQVAGTAAVERVDDQGRPCLAQRLELHELFEALQIVFAEIDFFAAGRVRRTVWKGRNTTFRGELRGPRFDVLGDFRQRGARVGGGEFQAVILRGIVAGCEVDGAIEFAGA